MVITFDQNSSYLLWQAGVRRWDGTNWVSLTDSLNVSSDTDGIKPVAAVTSDGRLVVTWGEGTGLTGPYDFFVKRYNGN